MKFEREYLDHHTSDSHENLWKDSAGSELLNKSKFVKIRLRDVEIIEEM